MVKKFRILVGVVIVGVLGVMTFCNKNNPVTPPPDKVVGVWVDSLTRQAIGAGYPDTFYTRITITSTKFQLLRSNAEFGSSGVIYDSSIVFGTWQKYGSDDSISFAAVDSCMKWDNGTSSWHKTSGGGAPNYDDCPDELKMKIDITNNVWTAPIKNFKDPHETFTFSLKKRS
jgi:hypothetical protein